VTKVRVQLANKPNGYATINPDATAGAVFGVNLRWPDGTIVTVESLGVGAGSSSSARTTDSVTEGVSNLYYTDARADARAAAAVATHAGLADPHPGYLTPAEGNAAYEPIGAVQAFKDAPALTLANLQNVANDAAAAAAGVAVGALYRNGSVLMIRVS